MNPEDLCKKMQEVKKPDSENYYEEEMSSQEYASKNVQTTAQLHSSHMLVK